MKNLIHFIIIVKILLFSIYNATGQDVILYEGVNYTGQSQIIPFGRLVDGFQMPLDGAPLNNKISSIKISPSPKHFRLNLFDESDNTGYSKAIKYSCPDLGQINMNDKISLIKVDMIDGYVASAFINKNDPLVTIQFDAYEKGYRIYDILDNKLNYYDVEVGYAAILWENADDAHDRQNKGFGKVFVIQGTGPLTNQVKDRQIAGPGVKDKVSYIKVVPVDKILESL